jgi:CheY-like chemotaxis protein
MRTILIADDEASLRLLVRATFAAADTRVLEAPDGAQALELIQREQPDLVLLDIQMPELTGLDVCKAVRADPSLRSTRIIMLTARAQTDDVRRGMEAGADAYLGKPFSPLNLLRTVDKFLGPSPG